mmetsp:Transcript_96682/g.167799  ORF Transcript_96682/g.167799 Transcript_96682/m.167799 type:complete len:279 (-) Transcript_96682:24-860(-)
MARDSVPFTMNDGVLLMTLVYSSIDIQTEWGTFGSCVRPVHQWLLSSYFLLLAFRLLHILGAFFSSGGASDFMMNLRQKDPISQLLMSLIWLLVFPAFSVWTMVGTKWLAQVWWTSPSCLPAHFFWFSILWQAVSYLWIAAHLSVGFVALGRERKRRVAEADLRALEDADTIARWGHVSRHHTPLVDGHEASGLRTGLSASEILALGGISQVRTSEQTTEECPICLADFRPGEDLRCLQACSHTFHRSCVDLWLLQRAACPLCKCEVKASTEAADLAV